MQFSGEYESINMEHHLGMRPTCPCCGGGEHRKGYTVTKAKSKKQTRKADRSKSQKMTRRDRAKQRPDKFAR